MKSKRAIKYIYDANPFYVHWKKHFCPKCGKKLELRYISKIVNSNSSEAKDYDLSVGDTFFVGDVEFRTRYFHCANCQFDISFKDMKKYEKKDRGQFCVLIMGQGDVLCSPRKKLNNNH